MIESIILIVIGLFFMILGFNIWLKVKTEMFQSYYIESITEEDKKKYTKKMGKGIIFLGCGMILNPLLNYFLDVNIGWFVMVLFFVLAMIQIFSTQKKYNKN